MAWIGALIGGAAGIAGNMISSSGQSSANDTNVALARENRSWQEHMANTAMQRRVADLKGAGLNPLLAVNTSGADVPNVANAQVQNPDQAYGQLGNQVTSAIQSSTVPEQKQLIHAQARNVDANTDIKLPEEVRYIQSQGSLTDAQAINAAQTFKLLKQQEFTGNEDMYQASLKSSLQSLDYQTARAVQTALISAMNSDAEAKQLGLPELRNKASLSSSRVGMALTILNGLLDPANSARQLFRK